MKTYASSGTLRYSDQARLVVEVDRDFSEYYRKLIPPWVGKPNRQLHRPHISVIRKEVPLKNWGIHDGEMVEFHYTGLVRWSRTYFWLDCFSVRLEEIRRELGLTTHPRHPENAIYRPDGFIWTFHMTIGNLK